MTVRTETEGIIVEMLVREGSRVSKGDVLARLRDFEKQQTLSELKGSLQAKQSELDLLRAGARPEEVDRKEKLVETKRVELANSRRIRSSEISSSNRSSGNVPNWSLTSRT